MSPLSPHHPGGGTSASDACTSMLGGKNQSAVWSRLSEQAVDGPGELII